MKKNKLFFMLTILGLLWVSCGSDDSGSDIGGTGGNSANVIVGNWSYIGDIDEDGYEEDGHAPCDDEFLKFNADGTIRNTINYCGEEAEVIDLFWQKALDTDKYIFSDGSGNSEEAKVAFTQNNNRMTIYEYEDEDGFYGIVYQRQ